MTVPHRPFHRNGFRLGFGLAAALVLSACGLQLPVSQAELEQAASESGATSTAAAAPRAMAAAAPAPKAVTVQNPILFVTQVPLNGDPFASRISTFANHEPLIESAPRGGDLMIRYPDGTVRNLTREAGFGMDGQQGANAIAVREPAVHWSGTRAVFSMVVGAPARQYASDNGKWQLYEVSGLARGETVRITKVPHQPTGYNNISPIYASDDRILFTSDRSGKPQIYRVSPAGGEAERLLDDGTTIGAVDLSTTWKHANPLGLTTVASLARLVEHELRAEGGGSGSALELHILGEPRASLGGRPLRLTQRQLEILSILAIIGPLTLGELHAHLYGDRPVAIATLKGEMSRLRQALNGQLTSRPYRLTLPFHVDAIDLLARLDQGDVDGAARLAGDEPDPLDLDFPTVQDGAVGVHFIQTALASGAVSMPLRVVAPMRVKRGMLSRTDLALGP